MAQGREAGPLDLTSISLASTDYLPTERNVPRETAPTELYDGLHITDSASSVTLQSTLADADSFAETIKS